MRLNIDKYVIYCYISYFIFIYDNSVTGKRFVNESFEKLFSLFNQFYQIVDRDEDIV